MNKVVKELERLEGKTNGLKVELNEFVTGSQYNIAVLQEAIKAHITFLNELDAR
jgi:ABC-type metal ion transport system substrate-binding protein